MTAPKAPTLPLKPGEEPADEVAPLRARLVEVELELADAKAHCDRRGDEERAKALEEAARVCDDYSGLSYGAADLIRRRLTAKPSGDAKWTCLCHQGIAPDTCPHHGPLLAKGTK